MKNNCGIAASFIAFLGIFASPVLCAAIELPYLISDGMVVQRQEPVPVWGWSDANTEITLEFAGEKKSVRSDDSGAWRAIFAAKKAGGPFELHIHSANDSRTVRDILVGDVWVCSGQSNMEWVLRNAENGEAEIAAAGNRNIRHFKVPRTWSVTPSERLAGGSWKAATSDQVGDFTAIGYYFAKHINTATGIPIGLLHSSWGGSSIETWMSPVALGEPEASTSGRMELLIADGESRAEAIKNRLSRWPDALVGQMQKAEADWSAGKLKEKDWFEISAPALWEQQGFDGVDGVIWYRKTFRLSRKQAKQGIVLGLARIDDNDITWVNGHKVGETNAYDAIRRYEVPADVLKAGKNQIAIRIEDSGGGGGIYSDTDLLYVETADGKKQSLAGEWKIKADKVIVSLIDNIHHTQAALYNKMLHPLFAFPVKGVLWYQGESNADTAEEAKNYRDQFQKMIIDWRNRWQKPELAFYWVQLANFISGTNTEFASPWAIVRESQTAALELPNTGQAITIDIGNPNDIHPRDKATVGMRLALIALNKTYGQKNIDYRGPTLDRFSIDGAKVKLVFNNASSGLTTANGDKSVKGFEVAGQDGQFKPAAASIQNDTVIISNETIPKPVAVRYAWDDNPDDANLVGNNKLPAEPFRQVISR